MQTGKKGIAIGAAVRIVPQHWLRPFEEGLIIDWRPRSRHNWLVRFEHAFPGGGIEGDKLWLDQGQFAEVEERSDAAVGDEESAGSNGFPVFPDVRDMH
jgi:hypothetical protein